MLKKVIVNFFTQHRHTMLKLPKCLGLGEDMIITDNLLFIPGIIGRHYRTGETIDVTVRLTANHKGYFKFRLCPVNNKLQKATEDCFQKYVVHSLLVRVCLWLKV